ncbi:MAG: biopolymer transport protein ExbD [Paracoccaceae bacterium]|jgi:biopolymer transport protein ExbD
MQFSAPRPPRRTRENIVPMINVVFLLLIFFLMTAQIAPPDPFDVTPPGSTSDAPSDGPATLYIAADGTLAYQGARGAAVFAALALQDFSDPLQIRADAALKASDLARLLPKLAAAGITDLALVTAPHTGGTP